ncbi:Kinesin-like protein [Meloidogyne graminicola]|uniref:Kinesin-like protein n=1 Tax=Meloidogyne graminicola TaxID=189291 RepID=A0A8S9ZDS6_9BILA|nr:Kinesin-like protein [Meloidogyne graminicola]
MSATKPRGGKIARKKNVQVAVRIRPSSSELSMGNENITSFDPVTKTVMLKAINASDPKRHTQGQKSFGPYDKVFGPESTQLHVYNGIVDSLMKEVLNGYNCTVFAYGQTGSGKTYTMEGSLGEYTTSLNIDPTAGIIPRALFQIFSELGTDDIDYNIRVSYVELYNEQIFDLLSQSETSQLESLRIFDDKIKGVFIAGVEEVIVSSHKEIYELLRRGAEKRRTASTLLNMTSRFINFMRFYLVNFSRSHSVFTVTVVIREPGLIDGEELLRQGKFNFVDLAGSENIERSGATNIRAREAGNINTSLLSLGRVINALTMGASHIPYRESKLTRILQDSLGGKTITTIMATISPASSNFEESVNTLDYAQRAKNIKNNPQVNLRITQRGLINEYNEEINRLRRDLLAAREKHGIYLAKENYDEMVETIDEKKAKIQELESQIEELEGQLEVQLHRFKTLLGDFSVMHQHYTSIYAKYRAAMAKLEEKNAKIGELSLELSHTKDDLTATTEVISVYENSLAGIKALPSSTLLYNQIRSTLVTPNKVENRESFFESKADLTVSPNSLTFHLKSI